MLLFVAFATLASRSQDVGPEAIRKSGSVVKVDTIVTTDTIIRTEVITRTDFITRREVVVRKDSVVGFGPSVQMSPSAVSSEDSSVVGSSVSTLSVPEPITVAPTVEEFPDAEQPVGDVSVSESGGRYVWVPDSMSDNVARTLSGATLPAPQARLESVDPVTGVEEHVDLNEKVLFRGDTVPMVLRDRNFGRFNRGLFNYLFIPKGIWSIGVTASYGEFSTSDLEVLDLISGIDFSGHMFSIRPYFSYFIGNNMSVGMRLSYTSGRANIGSFNVDIDDDMGFNLKDILYRSESYTAAVTFNQYFGIARRGRFGVFNEVELAFSSGSSDFNRPYGGVMKNTHTTSMQAALNFSPGVSVFILDPVSFNVSFGVFGFYLKKEKQMVDGERSGNRFTSGANFRFNIFNINFGVAVNL